MSNLDNKFSHQLISLRELFSTSWNDDDLLAVLMECSGDLETAISLISEGHAQQWEMKSKKNSKGKKNPSSEESASNSNNNSSSLGSTIRKDRGDGIKIRGSRGRGRGGKFSTPSTRPEYKRTDEPVLQPLVNNAVEKDILVKENFNNANTTTQQVSQINHVKKKGTWAQVAKPSETTPAVVSSSIPSTVASTAASVVASSSQPKPSSILQHTKASVPSTSASLSPVSTNINASLKSQPDFLDDPAIIQKVIKISASSKENTSHLSAQASGKSSASSNAKNPIINSVSGSSAPSNTTPQSSKNNSVLPTKEESIPPGFSSLMSPTSLPSFAVSSSNAANNTTATTVNVPQQASFISGSNNNSNVHTTSVSSTSNNTSNLNSSSTGPSVLNNPTIANSTASADKFGHYVDNYAMYHQFLGLQPPPVQQSGQEFDANYPPFAYFPYYFPTMNGYGNYFGPAAAHPSHNRNTPSATSGSSLINQPLPHPTQEVRNSLPLQGSTSAAAASNSSHVSEASTPQHYYNQYVAPYGFMPVYQNPAAQSNQQQQHPKYQQWTNPNN